MGAQTTYSSQPAIGYSGSLDRNAPFSDLTVKNVESSASIPFGKAVKFKTSSPDSDLDVLLPAAESDRIEGIVIRDDTYARTWTDDAGTVNGQLDGTGLIPGTLMRIATKGRMLVACASGCAPGDGLWVRAVAGVGETLGALENADDSTDTVDCTTQGRWLTTAVADGLAWLEFDFTNI